MGYKFYYVKCQTYCYRLNSVPPKFDMLNPNPNVIVSGDRVFRRKLRLSEFVTTWMDPEGSLLSEIMKYVRERNTV